MLLIIIDLLVNKFHTDNKSKQLTMQWLIVPISEYKYNRENIEAIETEKKINFNFLIKRNLFFFNLSHFFKQLLKV